MRVLKAVGFAALLASPWASAAEVEGTLAWANRAVLSTPVSGVIVAVDARPGQRVDEGHVLVRLDQRAFKAQLAAAQARLDSATHHYEEAQRELERSQEMYDRTQLSDHDLTLAKIAFAEADAIYQSAQAAVTRAEMDLQYSAVKAPFSAVVVERRARVGETVISEQTAPPLVTVGEVDRMLAVAEVSLETLTKLGVGDVVAVRAAGQRYDGRVHGLGAEPVAEGENRYRVEVIFDTAGRTLRPGQKATLSLP